MVLHRIDCFAEEEATPPAQVATAQQMCGSNSPEEKRATLAATELGEHETAPSGGGTAAAQSFDDDSDGEEAKLERVGGLKRNVSIEPQEPSNGTSLGAQPISVAAARMPAPTAAASGEGEREPDSKRAKLSHDGEQQQQHPVPTIMQSATDHQSLSESKFGEHSGESTEVCCIFSRVRLLETSSALFRLFGSYAFVLFLTASLCVRNFRWNGMYRNRWPFLVFFATPSTRGRSC